MCKKLIIAMLVVSGFASAPMTNAGTDIIRDYGAPAPNYNYAPPPRPIYYAPPPAVNVLVFPAYGYVGPRFHRFCARPIFWRSHPRWR